MNKIITILAGVVIFAGAAYFIAVKQMSPQNNKTTENTNQETEKKSKAEGSKNTENQTISRDDCAGKFTTTDISVTNYQDLVMVNYSYDRTQTKKLNCTAQVSVYDKTGNLVKNEDQLVVIEPMDENPVSYLPNPQRVITSGGMQNVPYTEGMTAKVIIK